jgi:AcrR family transcriptional regulator
MSSVAPRSNLENRRDGLKLSRDPRAARTRQAIIDAVMLLSKRPDSVISVSAVVKEARISRTAFYSHYASLDQLALELFERQFVGAIYSNGIPGVRFTIDMIVNHYIEHRRIYSAVLSMPLSQHTTAEAIRYLGMIIHESSRSQEPPAGTSRYMTSVLLAGAFIGAFDTWLRGEGEWTPDELRHGLTEILPDWIRPAVT